MPARRDPDGLWTIQTDRGAPLGRIHVAGNRYWEMFDAHGSAREPRWLLPLDEILQPSGEEDRPRWPSPSEIDRQAQVLLSAAVSGGFDAQLRLLLPHFASLIEQAFCEDSARLARAAMLFASLVRSHTDAPAVRQTQFDLDCLTYRAIAAVYEAPHPPYQEAALQACYRQAFRAWQTAIASPEQRWLFGPEQPDARREQAMLDLLTLQQDTRRRLRRFLREQTEGKNAVCTIIEQWYLPRYDLNQAQQLKSALTSLRSPAPAQAHRLMAWRAKLRRPTTPENEGGYLDPARGRSPAGIAIVVPLFVCAAVLYALFAVLWGRHVISGVAGQVAIQLDLAVLYLAVGLPLALVWLTAGRPDTSSPRLLAGILVGVLGTVLQQDWDQLASLASGQPLATVALALAFVLASYKVLLQKIYSATGLWSQSGSTPSAWPYWRVWWLGEANRRCRAVIGRGLMIAFLLSLALTDLLGNAYVLGTPDAACTPPAVPGLIGCTYPGLVLLFTPLLLFAGVFTQLIWQDQPITEALT